MNTKRAGWVFFWMTVAFLVVSLTMGIAFPNLGIAWSALLSELCLLVPAFIYVSKGKVNLASQLHLKGIRVSTVFLVIVYHICCYPAVIAMNALTLAVSRNEALDITEQFLGESKLAMWLFVGVIGPLVEELIFRGVMLGGLRTTGRIFSAIVLSALLFALIHMNLNQFSYTIVMGVYWGLLAEATGSLIPSMVCHVITNSVSVLMTFVSYGSLDELNALLGDVPEESTSVYIITGIVFLVISVFTTALAMLMLKVISLNEGRTGCFENIFRKKMPAEKYGRLFSVPMAAGILISASVMLFTLILDNAVH